MPVILYYTLQDADGDPSTVEIPLQSSTALAQAALAVEVMWDLINPLVTGTLVAAGFKVEASIGTFTNAAANVLSDVQEKAEFAFRTVNGFLKRLNLPTFDETLFAGGGSSKEVDITDSDVLAFTAAMTAGFEASTGNTVTPVDSRNEDLVTLVSAVENWGKRRR